ncbi:MAG: riboflavin synthase [Candidatus Lindowbacteria bacterium]|nr:riboflavin synthase [Candidatus Lindowbacteria bacterium]
MFTGIIREKGRVVRLGEIEGGITLEIEAPLTAQDAGLGDSISNDGCCLTVTEQNGDNLVFELSRETLDRTIALHYKEGSAINLEASLALKDKLGGHLVTGHVDAVAEVVGIKADGEFSIMTVRLEDVPPGLVAEKGSISVNGVSLTVAAWRSADGGGEFDVALIPETLTRTNMGEFEPGVRVNIEYDLIARYVTEAMRGRQ